MSMWKKMLISTLAFSIVAGGATSALAAKPDWAGKPGWKVADKDTKKKGKDRDDKRNNDRNSRGIQIVVNGENIILNFSDVEQESAWALEYIAELVKRGVFTGYEDGTFRPNQKVTRIEAITAAVRQMGLREEAESAEEMATDLNFKDADKIEKKYPWAVGYVAVAVENDLFMETEAEVQPEKPADRLWATILLVKALGLEDEAKQLMNTELPFKDKNQIPAGSVGYVAIALEKGLITGYENNTFRPDRPVTRAELAALLDRTAEQIPDQNTGYGEVEGTFNGIVNGKITIKKNGQTVSYTPSKDITVVRNNKLADLDDLVAGDKVEAVLSNNTVIYIKVVSASSNITDGQKTGTVSAVGSGKVTIKKDGKTTEYPVSSNATILRNGTVSKLSDVKVGDEVTAVVSGGKIIHLSVKVPVVENGQVTGVVSAVYSNKIDLTIDGVAVTYNVDKDATVVRNNALVELEAVQPGDKVNVVITNSEVTYLIVTDAISDNNTGVYTVVGTYQGHRTEDGKLVQISVTSEVNNSPVTRIYNVSANAVVNGNALALEKGESEIELVVVNQVVTVINIK